MPFVTAPRAALLAILLAGPAAAQTLDCSWAETQADMNACAAESWAAADEELNAAYEAALGTAAAMDDGSGYPEEALREAQRAWVAFRDLACEAEAAPHEGGSMQPLMLATCLERLTLARAADLWLYSGS